MFTIFSIVSLAAGVAVTTAEGGLMPFSLRAMTRKRYVVPFVSPAIVHDDVHAGIAATVVQDPPMSRWTLNPVGLGYPM